MKVLLTGANGRLGRLLVSELEKLRDVELEVIKRPPLSSFSDWVRDNHRLLNTSEQKVLFHFGWNTADRQKRAQFQSANEAINLAAEGERHGVNFVFVSSMAAGGRCLSNYGRAKRHAEFELLRNQHHVIRFGLVLNADGSDSHTLLSNSRYLHRLAHLRPQPYIATTSSDDFLSACLQTLRVDWKTNAGKIDEVVSQTQLLTSLVPDYPETKLGLPIPSVGVRLFCLAVRGGPKKVVNLTDPLLGIL